MTTNRPDHLNRVSVKAGHGMSITELQSLANDRNRREQEKKRSRYEKTPSVSAMMELFAVEVSKRSPTTRPTGKDAGHIKLFIQRVQPEAPAYFVFESVVTNWADFLKYMGNRDGWQPNAPCPAMGIILKMTETCVAYYRKNNEQAQAEQSKTIADQNAEANKRIWG